MPNVVNHLAYSPDGRLLAAALAQSNGIRLYDVNGGYEPLPSDNDYGDSSYWVDCDKQGRLVTTSYDGFIRLYASGHYDKSVAKAKGPGGSRPFSAQFSPNGDRIAVGYEDSTAVDLLSGNDLAFVQATDTSGVSGRNISSVGWSADGRYLFAGGQGNLSSENKNWSVAGRMAVTAGTPISRLPTIL